MSAFPAIRRSRRAQALLLAFASCLGFAPVGHCQPEDRSARIEATRLADGVLLLTTPAGYPNQLVLDSQQGFVVFGTLWSPEVARSWRRAIAQELGHDRAAYVVVTSARATANGGTAAFAGATFIAHQSVRETMIDRAPRLDEVIQSEIEVFRRKAERSRRLLDDGLSDSQEAQSHFDWMIFCDRVADGLKRGHEPTLPTVTFADRLTLDLGNQTLVLTDFGPGPHGHHIMVHVPEEGLVLAPISPMHLAPVPRAPGGLLDVPLWLDRLDGVLAADPPLRTVICGFSDLVPVEELANQREYIHALWEGVNRVTAEGLPFEAARERLSLDALFPHVRQWQIWREIEESCVREDHATHLLAYWRQLHPSAASRLAEMLETEDAPDVEAALREMRDDPRHRWFLDEHELNRLGYRLLGENRLTEAELVFLLNAETHPESANVHDSLGKAYMTAGRRDEAIASYRRSLELDPGNENARRMLERLDSEE